MAYNVEMIKNLLVPGGLGFIGSHTLIEIINLTKANVIILDNLSNCFDDVLDRVKAILLKTISEQEIKERI